jgi:hypothetical protein
MVMIAELADSTEVGCADMRPLAANDSPANRARDRRVELISLTPNSDCVEAARSESTTE